MILAALALAAAPAATLDAAIEAIFAPYRQPAIESGAAWERPIFTRNLRALIARWQAVTPTEADDLSEFDWVCQCQDWDPYFFRATVISKRSLAADRIEVRVMIRLEPRTSQQAQIVLQRERGRWLIDEMFSPDFKRGLRAAIRDTIAEDIELSKTQK
ncbi:MAG: DUF3828 domain-containing protein [Sphingomonadales bacterium]|nr:DUF3828 domain-containing protein [Sphingomonadales bacterium]